MIRKSAERFSLVTSARALRGDYARQRDELDRFPPNAGFVAVDHSRGVHELVDLA